MKDELLTYMKSMDIYNYKLYQKTCNYMLKESIIGQSEKEGVKYLYIRNKKNKSLPVY